jgi:uncharacterized protein (TIGR02246 family)
MQEAVASAWRTADSAAAAGDAGSLAALFAEEAVVVPREGDTIRGREAIRSWLSTALAGGATATARFNRIERLVECADWAVEEGVLRAWRRGAGAEDSVVTSIGLRWERASDSTARVSLATLDAPSARSLRRSARCRANTAVVLGDRRRWIVSLSPDGLVLVRAADAYDAMTARLGPRWNTGDSPLCRFCPRADRRSGSDLPLLSFAGVRYRGLGPFGVEAFVMDQHDEDYRFYDYDPSQAVLIHYEKSGLLAAALVNFERSWLRVGAGPAYSASAWTLYEERYTVPPQIQELTDDIDTFGAVGQLAITLPLNARFALDGRAQWFQFPKVTMRGTTYFGEVPYDPSGFALSFALGVLF